MTSPKKPLARKPRKAPDADVDVGVPVPEVPDDDAIRHQPPGSHMAGILYRSLPFKE